MKNLYTLLALLVVLASCSEWKYTRGITLKQPEYHASKAKATDAREERTIASVKDEPESAQEPESPKEPEEAVTDGENATSTESQDAEEITILVRNEDDSLQTVSPEMVRMAFDAEEQGRKSRNLGIAGLALTLTYIFAFIGLILSIIGLIKGINSLRSRYNTPKGLRMARAGIITSSIIVGLYVLLIIIVLTALFILW